MLELINAERDKANAPPLTLGDNIAAQLHAEASLAGCFSSSWGLDGLKPYMRYTLAGGYQRNTQINSGINYCIQAGDNYAPLDDIESEIRSFIDRLAASSDDLLDRWDRQVNIGLAWDDYNRKIVLQFAGNYAEYTQPPSLNYSVLFLFRQNPRRNQLRQQRRPSACRFTTTRPPQTLTPGQLARTDCYDRGLLVAALLPPQTDRERREFRRARDFTHIDESCPDPYAVPADAPPPNSPQESQPTLR